MTKKEKVAKVAKYLMYIFPELTMIKAVDLAAEIVEMIND